MTPAAADAVSVGAISVLVYRRPGPRSDMRHPALRLKSSNSIYFRGVQGRYDMAVREGWRAGFFAQNDFSGHGSLT